MNYFYGFTSFPYNHCHSLHFCQLRISFLEYLWNIVCLFKFVWKSFPSPHLNQTDVHKSILFVLWKGCCMAPSVDWTADGVRQWDPTLQLPLWWFIKWWPTLLHCIKKLVLLNLIVVSKFWVLQCNILKLI